jgi:hypothetical protein
MDQTRLACRACILAGLGAAVLALGAAQVPTASAAASYAPAACQVAALPPSPCVPVITKSRTRKP